MSCVRVLVLVAAAAALAGCTSGAANKAGGSEAPTVLTVGDSNSPDQPDTAAIRHFAAQVDKLSHGSLRIRIVYGAAGAATPYVEERVIRAVQSGRFDLGWIGARAWDEVDVSGFRALQAPFLITTTQLLNRVVTSPLAAEMLDSLSSQDVVGLALVPDFLRHPVGIAHKLTSPADFAGARIRIQPSRVSAALMRSLGAVPLEISNNEIGLAIDGGRVDAEELSLQNPVWPSIITGNLVFFPKALTLFGSQQSFHGLSDGQRRVVRAAAVETVRHVIARYPTDAVIAKSVCDKANRRRFVFATAGERAALLRKAQPVYRMLEANPQTRRFIERIKAWKRTTPADPPLNLAERCSRIQPDAQALGPLRPAALVNGTYRWVLTAPDGRAFWGESSDTSDLPMIGTAVLRDGTWAFAGPDHDGGTYSIHGDRLRFAWPRAASILVFRFTRDADGTIHLQPLLPMDEGDQFVWAYKPWKRIGPPTQLEH